MADAMRSNVDLKPLFNKLGHKLEEIRVRALKSLLSKLEHNLVGEADLVQERHLLIRLLEWFNFPSCPQKQDVLQLLHTLTKHLSAAGLVVEIGGVEFLTQLRPNVDPALHALIDATLDQLFHLPSSPPAHQLSAECVYRSAPQELDTHGHTTASSFANQSTTSVWSTRTGHSLPSTVTGDLHASTAPSNVTPTTRYPLLPGARAYTSPSTIPSPPDSHAGYFGMSHSSTSQQPHTPPGASAACFKFSTFPWVALMPTDRHVLSSTDTSLRNKDAGHVVSACEFLSDVVFQDFPAEVFVQRPNIVKSLLSLVDVRPTPGTMDVARPAVQALSDLSAALRARIRFYQDPALYTPKQEFSSSRRSSASALSQSLGSTDTRPSLVGRGEGPRLRGDGQDGDLTPGPSHHSSPGMAEGADGAEELDYEDMAALQFTQWSLPQYAVSVLHTTAPLLGSASLTTVTTALQLLRQILPLLRESISPALLWEDHSVAAAEISEKLTETLEQFADGLQYHHHSGLSAATPGSELRQHQMAFIGIARFVSDLLEFAVPVEQVDHIVPDFCRGMLTTLVTDTTLALSHPEIREATLPYLQRLSPSVYEDFNKSQHICKSQQAASEFLSKWPEQLAVDLAGLVSLARDGLDSLVYHQHLPYVDACMQLASHVARRSKNAAFLDDSRQLVLSLLAHPLDVIRLRAYATTRDIVMDALGVGHAVDPESSASRAAAFLLHPHVLYELTCFGLSDSVKKIEEMAGQILLHLLQGQLLMSSAQWSRLLQSLTPVLPILQGFAAIEKGLGGCVLGLLETDSDVQTGGLSLHERLRGTLRLMYRQETRVRTEGLGRLAYFLTRQPDATNKLPQFSDLQVGDLTNLLLVTDQTYLQDDQDDRSVFQEEGLRKVYDIFASDVVEDDVKKAAVDQLGIMLQDPALHAAFRALKGTSLVLKHLHEGIKRPEYGLQNPSQTMLPSLMKVLRHLVQRDFSLRHELARNTEVYYTVIRVALLYSGDEDARREASLLLAFLLWDEVASVATWDAEAETKALKDVHFSLPIFVTNRYRLPFRCATHHTRSPYARSAPPSADPLHEGLLGQAIRVDWHVNWRGGMDALIKECGKDGKVKDEGYTGPLQLTTVDCIVLAASYLPAALRDLLHGVQNATSHRAVSSGVSGLTAYLVVSGSFRVGPVLTANKWHQSVDRFFRVRPSSSVDESLLTDILRLLTELLAARGGPDPELVQWLSGVVHTDQGALTALLSRPDHTQEDLPEGAQHSQRLLNRELLKFIQVFVAKLPYCLTRKIPVEHQIRGLVTQASLARLSSANATHFYNLASLERTLLALVHITARPGWSVGALQDDSLTLCLQMLNTLLEVVAAFHVGRGGLSMSYMGRGVTRSATLCLRHLAYEMATQLHSQDWPRNWLFSRQGSSDLVGESGLGWLTTLWTYRDTEVRAAGLGIAVALTSTEAGRLTMATQCQHIHGGVWGAAFSVLLDHSECSLVRQQAASLLVNLTSQPLPSSPNDVENAWRGPVIKNDHTQESLVGLPALLALLQHTQFYQEVLVMLNNYYTQPAIHPVSVSADGHSVTIASSHNTMTTSGSGTLHEEQEAGWKPVTSTPVSGESTPRDQPIPMQNPSPPAADQIPSSQTTSSGSGTVAEYQSVTGPGLVAVIVRLLQNLIHLAPQETIHSLSAEGVLKMMTGVIDVGLMESYLHDVSSNPMRGLSRVALTDQLRAHIAVVGLFQTCVCHDQAVLQQVLQETTTLKHLCCLLAVSTQAEGDVGTLCEGLWGAVMTLMSTLLQEGGQDALRQLTPILTRHWATVAARSIHILQTPALIDSPVWFSTLHLLAVLMAEEGRAEVAGTRPEGTLTITYRLETTPKTGGDSKGMACPSGFMLCMALVQVYDTVSLHQGERALAARSAVSSALSGLLAVSLAAKATALESGLVETLSDQLRRQTTALNMEALETPKVARNNKTKDQPNISELVLTIDLLRNFMYDSYEVKLAAYECGLAQCLHKLWAWSQVAPPLLSAVLALLSTFTARCLPACSSLVFTSAQGPVSDRGGPNSQYSQHSLVHCLMKLARKEVGPSGHVPTLKAVHAVLATISLSQECRGVLWKSNFLHEFSNLSPQRPKKTRIQQAEEGCWLRLVVNLSFSTDGQGMILKVKEALSLLVEFADCPSEPNARSAILTLHNLCFHAANKPKLLANSRISQLFVDSVESGTDETRQIASSALLALTNNCQKAKVALKTTATVRRLQETYNTLIHHHHEPQEDDTGVENLRNVLALLIKGLS